MIRKLLLVAGILTLVAAPAAAQQAFDFFGQALVPAAEGGTLTMYSTIVNGGEFPTPLPLDFDNFEYTLVITNLTLDVDAFQQQYSGGSIVIYEDAGSAADYTNPATFTDGTVFLSGTILNLNRRIIFVSSGTGDASGSLDWTGGSMLNEMAPVDQLGWSILVGISGGATVQTGYDETWDGKVEPLDELVGTEQSSFGRLKWGF
jgi:hypothetical protein